jgi:hypothetical protein
MRAWRGEGGDVGQDSTTLVVAYDDASSLIGRGRRVISSDAIRLVIARSRLART